MSGKTRLTKKSVQTQSFALKVGEYEKKWILFDAEDAVLGRLAAVIAPILRGKHKPTFTPSIDCGDNVIVINADKVAMTGKKAKGKLLHRHTGYPGGIKSQSRAAMLVGQFPERVIEKAIERMMPRGPLGRHQMGNLKVYAGPEHPHAAQNPVKINFTDAKAKNKKGR